MTIHSCMRLSIVIWILSFQQSVGQERKFVFRELWKEAVSLCCITSDGKDVYAIGANEIRRFRVDSGALVWRRSWGHATPVQIVAVPESDELVVSIQATSRPFILRLDASDGSEFSYEAVGGRNGDARERATVSPDARYAVSVNTMRDLALWKLGTEKAVAILGEPARLIAFSGDSSKVGILTDSGELRLHRVSDGALLWSVKSHAASAIAMSYTGHRVVTAGWTNSEPAREQEDRGAMRVFDGIDGHEVLKSNVRGSSNVTALALSDNGERLVVVTELGDTQLFDLPGGLVVGSHDFTEKRRSNWWSADLDRTGKRMCIARHHGGPFTMKAHDGLFGVIELE